MRIVIGTYRERAYIGRCLNSIAEHVSGVTEIVFVDDSGNPSHSRWLEQYGAVSQTHAAGYNEAMQEVCRVAGNEPFAFVEEDFTFTSPVDLNDMAATIDAHPDLAQLALLRGPHFPIEHEHGGVLEGLVARLGQPFVDLRREPYGWSQRGTFTGNPAVWRAGIAADGWPRGRWSEDKMRDRLLADGYRFGFLNGVRVAHDGVRSGKGY